MSRCEVTLSANAGAVLRFGPLKIWVDALHDDPVPGFSTVSPELFETIQKNPVFADPDILFTTHRHPDHFSRKLTGQILKKYPNSVPALPVPEFDGQFLISEQNNRLSVRGAELRFFRLTHEGEQYADVPNYGCIINYGGFHTLLAGDAAVADPALAEAVDGERIDLMLLNFPWLTLRSGRAFLQEVLRPEHLIFFHLPFEQDDRWGYRRAAEKALPLLRGIPDVRLLYNPMQTEYID